MYVSLGRLGDELSDEADETGEQQLLTTTLPGGGTLYQNPVTGQNVTASGTAEQEYIPDDLSPVLLPQTAAIAPAPVPAPGQPQIQWRNRR